MLFFAGYIRLAHQALRTHHDVLPPLPEVLIDHIGEEAKLTAGQSLTLNPEAVPQTQRADLETWEHHIETTIESDSLIPDTDREALIVARRDKGCSSSG
jgi:hypothetical protein